MFLNSQYFWRLFCISNAPLCRCSANNFLARKCKCGYVGLPRAMETKHSKRGLLLQKILLRSKASCSEGITDWLNNLTSILNLAFYEFGSKDLFDPFHNSSYSTLYSDVLKIKTIIVKKQNIAKMPFVYYLQFHKLPRRDVQAAELSEMDL